MLVDEHEQILQRVVGIDVAKASGMVCQRVPHDTIPDKRVTTVWPVQTTTDAVGEFGPGGEDEAFGDAVRAWAARWDFHGVDLGVSHDVVERGGELSGA